MKRLVKNGNKNFYRREMLVFFEIMKDFKSLRVIYDEVKRIFFLFFLLGEKCRF